MTLSDQLQNLAMRAKGWRDAAEAQRDWLFVLRRLRWLELNVARRNPAVDAAADWVYRELASAPISEEMRTEAGDLIAKIKSRVGASVPSWRPSPAPRRVAT